MNKTGARFSLQWLSGLRGWILILACAAGLRFYRLDRAVLWFDEAFSLAISEHSPRVLFEVCAADVHPPLYYLVLKGWVWLFGDGVEAIRSLSALMGVVIVGLVIWLTTIIANRRAAVLAGFLLALLPIAVRYSQEVRMYALVGLLMTGAAIALVYWVKQPLKHRYLAAYAVLIAAALYTHYFAFTVICAHWLYLMIVRAPAGTSPRRLALHPAWWVANLAAAVMFLPWLPTFIRQLGNTGNLGWITPVTAHSIPSLFWQYLTLVDGTQLHSVLLWGLAAAVFALCIFCVASDHRSARFCALLGLWIWVPPVLAFAVSLSLPIFIPRYLMISALALPILVAVAVDRLMRDHRRIAALILILALGLEATGLRNLYDPQRPIDIEILHRNERIDVIADYINSHVRIGDQVILLNNFWYSSLAYYLEEARALVYAPTVAAGGEDCPLGRYCRIKAPYESGRDDFYVATLDGLPADIRRIWLVDGSHDSDVGLTLPCRWQLLDTLVTGDNRLRLFEINAGQLTSGAKPCPAP